MNVGNETGTRTQMFYGWRIVLAGFVIVAFGLGAQSYMMSLLLPLVRDEFHGGPEAFGLAISIPILAGGLALLAAGPLIDRFGPRRIMLIGILLAGLGFLGISVINNLLMLSVCGVLIGIGSSIGLLLPVQTATANWFIRRRSIALATISAAAVLGIPLMGLVGSRISDQFGWRGAFLAIGLVMLVIGIPLALIIRHRPEDYDELPDGKQLMPNEDGRATTGQGDRILEANFTLRETLRTRAFWLLSVALAFSTSVAEVTKLYLVPLLIDKGFADKVATQFLEASQFVGLVGILIFGYLGDILSKRHLLALAVAIQSASVLILLTAGSLVQVYLYLLVFGLGSGTIPLLLAIRADYFGRKAFATITVAMMLISRTIGIPLSAFFPNLGGWLYNVTGSYQLALLLSMLIGFIPATLFLLSKPPEQPAGKRVQI